MKDLKLRGTKMAAGEKRNNGHTKELAPPEEDHRQLSVWSALVLGLHTAIIVVITPPCALLSLLWKLLPTRKKSLRDKVVLVRWVTGAGRGLGKGLALRFAKEGCKVAVADINKVNAKQTTAEIIQAGGVAKAYCANVARVQDVQELQKDISVELGPVDILVNNAGLLKHEPLENYTDDDIRDIVDVNLTSHFWMVRAFLPAMRERNSGHIVAISSLGAFVGQPNCTAYVATKHGVKGFMETVKSELELNRDNKIKTTTVFPYFINTSADYMKTWDLRLPAMSVEEAVEGIICGIRKNKELLFVPGIFGHLLPLLQVFPSFLRSLALRTYSIRVHPTSSLSSTPEHKTK